MAMANSINNGQDLEAALSVMRAAGSTPRELESVVMAHLQNKTKGGPV